jgi:Mg2+ and Co2+ transporter CorA
MNERYQRSLDEKRNFWGFTLGLVTIATFPFAVMTGYFGMNFENMAGQNQILTSEFWPVFPGVFY